MKLLQIACYQLEHSALILPITKSSISSKNIVIYDRQMSHYEIYFNNSIIFIVTLLCHDIIKDNF